MGGMSMLCPKGGSSLGMGWRERGDTNDAPPPGLLPSAATLVSLPKGWFYPVSSTLTSFTEKELRLICFCDV